MCVISCPSLKRMLARLLLSLTPIADECLSAPSDCTTTSRKSNRLWLFPAPLLHLMASILTFILHSRMMIIGVEPE
jgi:hypothetical protein